MRRVSREAMRMRLTVTVAAMRPSLKKHHAVHSEYAQKELVELLLQRIMGSPASEAVILEPDMVGSPLSPSRGRWDIDEPHPHPDLRAHDY